MSGRFDFSSYGAFKETYARTGGLVAFARKIGLKNRYLKFVSIFPRNLLVVEIGCGNGSFIQEMVNFGFKKVIGIEPSSSYQPVVNSDFIFQEYAEGFFEKLPEASVGGVVAWDVFEHLAYQDIKGLLIKIRLALISNGCLVIRVPNMGSPFGMVNFFGDVSHVSALSENSIRQIAFETGMELEGAYPEPFSRPLSVAAAAGFFVWPIVNCVLKFSYAAFGIKARIFTPNIIFMLRAK